ncbi:MAG: type IX secretion system membrane protein PorP/SprF, partial [Bacteroidota bacterium]
IEPNVLLKTDGVVTQVDLGILGYYERLIGGLSLRGYGQNSIDALGILAGTKVSKHVRISYSFDIGLSGVYDVQDGTHEFVVNYNLNKPIRTGELPKIIYNPRFR